MSTLTKPTAELTQQNLDTSSSPTVRIPKPALPGAAPSPLCAEIQVRVSSLKGGAATEVAEKSADEFTEETQTLILFPRGAVVRLAAPVKPGQEVMLTNLKSQHNVHCKVVSVRASEKDKGYVELEFTHRAAGFWGNFLVTAKAAGSAATPAKARPSAQPARLQSAPAVAAPSSEPAAPRLDFEPAKNQVTKDLHPGRKWILTGASIAAGVLAVAGGISMFQSRPAIAASARANSQPAAEAAAGANVIPQVIVVRADEEPAKPSSGTLSSGPAAAGQIAKPHLSIGNSKLTSPAAAQPTAASTEDNLPGATSDDSTPPAAGAAPIGLQDSTPAPPPLTESAAHGPATLPRAISMVRPQYPDAAKYAHVEGEVTIQADIDASGNVVAMKAISGPPALHSGALEALQQWKYEPARLDGQPVKGQVLVTFKFRRQ
jgi:TonB family protein